MKLRVWCRYARISKIFSLFYYYICTITLRFEYLHAELDVEEYMPRLLLCRRIKCCYLEFGVKYSPFLISIRTPFHQLLLGAGLNFLS